MPSPDLGQRLLAWYDLHARTLPWRVGPAQRAAGRLPDPYRVWLSEVMLQQTTVAAAKGYFERFTHRWPTVQALAAAPEAEVMAEWAGLGYYARARNLIACARVMADEFGGQFPRTGDELVKLPGIGPYTAAAIAAIAFDRPETVVDGNVERVMARLHAVEEPLPAAKRRLAGLAARLTPPERPGDHAQALMDLGATVCTPKSPSCGACPWAGDCAARRKGLANVLPRRAPRAARPTRHGIAYIARRADGAWLVERRPARGLLGGMLGWPGSEWGEAPAPAPPLQADWADPGAQVRHTFTHFHLHLSLRVARLGEDARPERGFFMPAAEFDPASLPSVMRKAHALAAPLLKGF